MSYPGRAPSCPRRDTGWVMSEESTTPDLELLRQALEPLNSCDLDALMGFYAPEAVLDTTRTVGVAFHGRAAIRGLYEDWMGAYEELEWRLMNLSTLAVAWCSQSLAKRLARLAPPATFNSARGFFGCGSRACASARR